MAWHKGSRLEDHPKTVWLLEMFTEWFDRELEFTGSYADFVLARDIVRRFQAVHGVTVVRQDQRMWLSANRMTLGLVMRMLVERRTYDATKIIRRGEVTWLGIRWRDAPLGGR